MAVFQTVFHLLHCVLMIAAGNPVNTMFSVVLGVEHCFRNRQVVGSIPTLGSTVLAKSRDINQLTF